MKPMLEDPLATRPGNSASIRSRSRGRSVDQTSRSVDSGIVQGKNRLDDLLSDDHAKQRLSFRGSINKPVRQHRPGRSRKESGLASAEGEAKRKNLGRGTGGSARRTSGFARITVEFRDRTSSNWRRDFAQSVWYDGFAFAVSPGKRPDSAKPFVALSLPQKAEEISCVFLHLPATSGSTS